MSINKQYTFGGLNLRQSDLVVPKSAATDLKNVELNYAGELVKRRGFHIDTSMPAVVNHETCMVCVADSFGSLDGTYFVMKENTTDTVAFWIDVDDDGTAEPAGSAGEDRSVEVTTILTGMSAQQVASQLRLAIDADAAFDVPNVALEGAIDVFLTGFSGAIAVGDTVDGTPGTGFTFVNIEAGNRKNIVLLDEYNQANELVAMAVDGLHRKVGSTFVKIPQDQLNPEFKRWRGKVSAVELSGSLYIGDSEGDNHVYKYDGLYFYRAGMPKLELDSASDTQGGTPPFYFYRAIYTYIDANQNIINSDFGTFNYEQSVQDIVINTLRDTAFNGRSFTAVGAQVGFPATNLDGIATIATTATTVGGEPVISVGDVVFMNTFDGDGTDLIDPDYYGLQSVLVSAVTANSVTIDISELVDDTFISDGITREGNAVDVGITLSGSNLMMNLFFSEDEFFNYELYDVEDRYGPFFLSQATSTETFSIDPGNQSQLATDAPIFMDDLYDTTIVKGEIPKLKFLTSYQNALVGANVTYPNTPPRISDQNQVVWSDFSIGGSLESFAPFDFVQIGRSNNTEVTAVFGAQDSIVIFKSNRVYFLNGTLLAGEFRIRESLSEGIGCVGNNSITEVSDGALFMSDRGVYHVMGGNKPTELSDVNEPLFDSDAIVLEDTFSALDSITEHTLIFLKGIDPVVNRILFYDYYFNQWFLIEDVPMGGPMVFYNKEMYLADEDGLVRKPGDDYRDEITAGVFENVTGSYSTGWLDLDNASLRKKFVNLVMFSLDRLRDFTGDASPPAPNFTLDIKTQIDWINTDKELFTMDFTDEVRADDHKLAITQSKSLRFVFENSENANMLLTGYQFEWQATQQKPKMVR